MCAKHEQRIIARVFVPIFELWLAYCLIFQASSRLDTHLDSFKEICKDAVHFLRFSQRSGADSVIQKGQRLRLDEDMEQDKIAPR